MSLHCLGGKWTKHKGVVRDLQSQGVKFDNVGLPYDHPIPHIPIPPKFVLERNKHDVHIVEAIFQFWW